MQNFRLLKRTHMQPHTNPYRAMAGSLHDSILKIMSACCIHVRIRRYGNTPYIFQSLQFLPCPCPYPYPYEWKCSFSTWGKSKMKTRLTDEISQDTSWQLHDTNSAVVSKAEVFSILSFRDVLLSVYLVGLETLGRPKVVFMALSEYCRQPRHLKRQ